MFTPDQHASPETLQVSGTVNLPGLAEPSRVARGMTVVSRDGREVGKVAAVVVDGVSRTATHVLISRVPRSPEYRLAAPGEVARVTGDTVELRILSQEVDALPVHGDCEHRMAGGTIAAGRAGARRALSMNKGDNRMTAQAIQQRSAAPVGAKAWVRVGLTAAAASIVAVLAVQALALAIWPDIALFKPLDSLARSAVFTLVPAIGATAVFAGLARRSPRPESKFIVISAVVLLVSIIPDYAIPVPHKSLLASSVTAFMHVVAGAVTVTLLLAGYRGEAARR